MITCWHEDCICVVSGLYDHDKRRKFVVPVKHEFQRWCSLVSIKSSTRQLEDIAGGVLMHASKCSATDNALPPSLGIRGVGGGDCTISVSALDEMDVQKLATLFRQKLGEVQIMADTVKSDVPMLRGQCVAVWCKRLASLFEDVWRISNRVLKLGKYIA